MTLILRHLPSFGDNSIFLFRFNRVWIGVGIGLEHFDEAVREVGMRAAVATALGEGKVIAASSPPSSPPVVKCWISLGK
jgi:hypothetical protein